MSSTSKRRNRDESDEEGVGDERREKHVKHAKRDESDVALHVSEDKKRKLEAIADEEASLLKAFEEKYENRYTLEDKIYKECVERQAIAPPIVANYYGKTQYRGRGNYRNNSNRGRGYYGNRANNYNRNYNSWN